MSSSATRAAVERVFQYQALICRAGDAPVSADMLDYAAREVAAGGPSAKVVEGWSEDPGASYLGVRYLAAVHRLVLSGQALELGSHFPTAGGRAKWPYLGRELTELVEDRAQTLREWIRPVPQTNEVGRSAALSVGFHAVAERFGLPLRLLEPGASAGLNLRFDDYAVRLRGSGGPLAWGSDGAGVVVEVDWEGGAPVLVEKLEVASRRGCEIAPFVLIEDSERRRLESYVWPDHVDRLMRLRRAIAAALRDPVLIDEASAPDWLPNQLGAAQEGRATVVYHSSFWAYLSERDRGRITRTLEDAGARATAAGPLAWLRLEEEGAGVSLRLRTWPDGEDRKLADVADHGATIRYVPA